MRSVVVVLLLVTLAVGALATSDSKMRKHLRRSVRGHHSRQTGDCVAAGCGPNVILGRLGPYINQNPTGPLKCWLAVTAMMENWRANTPKGAAGKWNLNNINSIFPTGSDLRQLADSGQALPPNKARAYATQLQLTDEQQSLPTSEYCRLLREYGPMFHGGLSDAPGAAANVWGHARLVVGITGNCNGEDARIHFVNPDGALLQNKTMAEMRRNLEAFQGGYNTALTAQIAQLRAAGTRVTESEADTYRYPLAQAHYSAKIGASSGGSPVAAAAAAGPPPPAAPARTPPPPARK